MPARRALTSAAPAGLEVPWAQAIRMGLFIAASVTLEPPHPPPATDRDAPMTFSFSIALVWLDLAGVFCVAVSWALLAARKAFDIVGSLLLASMVGLGGGMIRDIIINAGPPA